MASEVRRRRLAKGSPMVTLKIALDEPTYLQLTEIAARELRPIAWQAEWLLRKAIQADVEHGEVVVPTVWTPDMTLQILPSLPLVSDVSSDDAPCP